MLVNLSYIKLSFKKHAKCLYIITFSYQTIAHFINKSDSIEALILNTA